MNQISRRALLKASATVGAMAGVPTSARVAKGGARAVVIFDSRLQESRLFVQQRKGSLKIDIAGEEATGWQMLRSLQPAGQTIEGFTGWSDWVAIRGELEARGWRFESDDQVKAPISGKSHLFRWSLKARA